MKRSKDIPKLVETYNNDRKAIRRRLIDITVNTDGTFSIDELVLMPSFYINEIIESYKDKNEKQQQAIDAAKGKNTRTF